MVENIKQNWIVWLIAAAAIVAGVYLFGGKVYAADKGKPPVQNIFADAPVAKLNWSGFYFGIHGGYSAANGEIVTGGGSLDGLSATGMIGGLTAGADWQVPGSALVLGARGGYTWSDAQFTLGPFAARMDDGWHADGRIGFAMGTALPYVFGGYGKTNTSLVLGGPAVSGPDLEGWRAGGGVEWRLPAMGTGYVNPTLALEYMHRNFDDIALGGGAKLDITDQTFMGRVNLRFLDGYRSAK